jgi:hypothetical protein
MKNFSDRQKGSFTERAISLSTLAFLPTFLLAITTPNPFAMAADFDTCASSLINSGIAKEKSAAACADALEPGELSACVNNIRDETALAAEDTLKACYRVRRPEDLASCVVSINSQAGGSEITALALDNCRRSLLPTRYAECVVGLNSSIADLGVSKAMESCISAEDFPSNLFSSSH